MHLKPLLPSLNPVILLSTLLLLLSTRGQDLCLKEIEDVRFEASSSYQFSVGAHLAALRSEEGGGAWCPKELITKGRHFKKFTIYANLVYFTEKV